MKRVVLAISVFVFITGVTFLLLYGSNSGYLNFSKAKEHDKTVRIIAVPLKNTINYNPAVNPEIVTFYAIDSDSNRAFVVLKKPLPPEFTSAEKIVLIGRWQDTEFIAKDVLLKCPSKYKE